MDNNNVHRKMIYQYDTTFNSKNLKIFSKIFSNGNIAVGKYQQLLRERIKKITGCKYVFLTTSGTSALHLALLSLGVSDNDEVITPSYLCEEVLNAIRYAGANPRFVDINSDNYSMDITQTRKSVSNKTKAVIVPYMHGDVISIEELKSDNIPIIEDIAHCTGGIVKNKRIGSLGDLGMTSFGDRKYLDGGFGGALFTNNILLAKKIHSLLTLSGSRKYRINYNYNIPNVIAAIIYKKSLLLNDNIKKRRKIATYYINNLKNENVLIRYNSIFSSFFYRFMIDLSSNKNKFIQNMASNGVICGVGVKTPLHKVFGNKQNLLNTDFATKKSIALPIRPNLSKNELTKIIKAIRNCL